MNPDAHTASLAAGHLASRENDSAQFAQPTAAGSEYEHTACLDQPPLEVCKRELDALLAALDGPRAPQS